jgi:hypothetical protein
MSWPACHGGAAARRASAARTRWRKAKASPRRVRRAGVHGWGCGPSWVKQTSSQRKTRNTARAKSPWRYGQSIAGVIRPGADRVDGKRG